MQEINLKLSIEELNHVVHALGEQPFARVYALVGKIQQQAAEQIQEENPTQIPDQNKSSPALSNVAAKED